ncbi:hypothetical protein LTR28_012816, partial [Elasticomyces elasticus]
TWSIVRDGGDGGAQRDALPDLPDWVYGPSSNVWAPDVNELDDGSYVMYFSATTAADTSKHCVGAATSRDILGPYTALPTPLFCDLARGGAIDASGFKDWADKGGGWPSESDSTTDGGADATGPEYSGGGRGGDRYVVYKIDGNSIGHGGACRNAVEPIVPTPLMLQRVAADGVTLVGDAVQVLDNGGAADDGVVEAPSLVKTAQGGFVLFFSSGCFATSAYTVSYATAASVAGPYTRRGALFRTDDAAGLTAPGSASVLWDTQHMLFHANYVGGGRALYSAMVAIEGDVVTVV